MMNWSDPTALFTSRLLEIFTDLDENEQNGVSKLLTSAYWCGVKLHISDYGYGSLSEDLKHSKDFVYECIENAEKRNDVRRVEAEKIIIKILEITQSLIEKENLGDFLSFLEKNTHDVRLLQNKLVSLTGQWMQSGERIYDDFLDFHKLIIFGLNEADLIPDGKLRNYPFIDFRFLRSYSNFWDGFMQRVITEFVSPEDLKAINGNLDESKKRVKDYNKFVNVLTSFPLKGKMILVYLWGYPEVFQIANKDFLPEFEQWLEVLKIGYLDHRSWIFEKDNIAKLIKAYKDVKKGIMPQEGFIDQVSWSFKDIYNQHPRGKELSFWNELLIELNNRLKTKPKKQELSRDILATLQTGY